MYCTVEGELEIAATVWVQLCAYVGVGVWMDVCVCVCVRGYACTSFILLLTEEPAVFSLDTSGASIPCNSLTLHMHSVTVFLSSSFLLPSLIPCLLLLLHLPLQRGRTWVLFNLAGLYWHIVGNPRQAIECHHCAIHMCPHIHHSVGFVGLSNTLRRLGKLDDAVKASWAALDVNFDEVGVWCVLVYISGASVDAYTVHVTRNFTKSDDFAEILSGFSADFVKLPCS